MVDSSGCGPRIVEIDIEKECASLPPFACPICGRAIVEYDPEVPDDMTEAVLEVAPCEDLDFIVADELGDGFHFASAEFEARLRDLNLPDETDMELDELLALMRYDARMFVLKMNYASCNEAGKTSEHVLCCGFHLDFETGPEIARVLEDGFRRIGQEESPE